MPDWRKASDYCFPSDYPSFRWAWEFLRRNSEYRKAWDAALSRYLARTGEFIAFPGVTEILETGLVQKTYIGVTTDHNDPRFSLPLREGDKWRLIFGMLNPKNETPDRLAFSVGYGHVKFFPENQEQKISPAGPHYAWAAFDLTLPLQLQTESVLETLRREKKWQQIKSRRVIHHRGKWPYYLRLLDADLSRPRVKPGQIAEELHTEPGMDGLDAKKVWDQLRAAKKMTQPDGYLSIFLSKP